MPASKVSAEVTRTAVSAAAKLITPELSTILVPVVQAVEPTPDQTFPDKFVSTKLPP